MDELTCFFARPGDKLVLRLNRTVWHKIDQDRQHFSRDVRTPLPLSGFVSRLIQNDWQATQDGDTIRCPHLLPTRPAGETEIRRLNISAELVRFINAHPELQAEILKPRPSDGQAFFTLHRWTAAILENYASRPDTERELLYLYPLYRTCNIAISGQANSGATCFGQLRVTFSENRTVKKLLSKPYSLFGGHNLPYNYLTGLYKDPNEASADAPRWQPFAVRLDRISDLSLAPGRGLTAAQRQTMQSVLSTTNIAYLREENVEVRVRFTDTGLDMLQWIVSNRPDFSFDRSQGSNTVILYTSEKQAYIYLNRFGAEAEVLHPVSLRHRLQEFYRQAAQVYEVSPAAVSVSPC